MSSRDIYDPITTLIPWQSKTDSADKMEIIRSVWTSHEGTMAQETAAHRWPKIIRGMIDDIQLTCDTYDCHQAKKEEGDEISRQLYDLRHRVMTDAALG